MPKKPSDQNVQTTPVEREQQPVFRIPGFVNDKDIGLGDVIKRATTMMGIKPCGGCNKRAALLNHWVGFSGRHR